MSVIRPKDEPGATAVAAGDIFLLDGTTGVRGLDSSLVPLTNFANTFTAAQAFGVLTATSVNGNTWTAGTGVLTIAAAKTLTVSNTLTLAGTDGKTLTVSNSLALAGTDGTVMTFPSTSATIARTDAANTFTGTQTIGALVATTINGNTFTAGTGVLTIAAAKTLRSNNTLTFAGTDGTVMTFPGTSATIARTDAANTFTGHQTIEGVTSTGATGTGNMVFATTPTLTTPVLGVATATSINKVALTAPATGATLTIADGKTATFDVSHHFTGIDATITFQGTDTYVGRTTTDTLTNKTINGASNTLTVRAASDITGTLPVANGGTNYTGGAWTAYTATVTPGSGTITTQSSSSSYLQIGKLVHIQISILITNHGSATGTMVINLPVASAAGPIQVLTGRESAVTGAFIAGAINPSASTMDVRDSTNATPTYNTPSDGKQLVFNGIYLAA